MLLVNTWAYVQLGQLWIGAEKAYIQSYASTITKAEKKRNKGKHEVNLKASAWE